jgi:tryptophanyl-tRNA synthetase
MLTTKTERAHLDGQADLVRRMVATVVGCGVDLRRTSFFLQSGIPELSQIFAIIQSFVSADRVLSSPTLIETRTPDYSFGLAAYPVLESADIIGIGAELVPVGEDNVDHIEIARVICDRLIKDFNAPIVMPAAVVSGTSQLIGTDGLSKMSKSVGNAILLNDEKDVIARQVASMPWPDGDDGPMRTYLRVFAPDEHDRLAAAGWTADPRTVVVEVLDGLIRPIRERAREVYGDGAGVAEALRTGTELARDHASTSLVALKNALSMTTLSVSADWR